MPSPELSPLYCPGCGIANKRDQQYCQQCTTELPVTCAGCGQFNAVLNRYCCGCGQPVNRSDSTPLPASPANPLDQAERRQLTVMFCDLVGSTALSQKLDPEDLRDLIHAFQQQCALVSDRFDGYIARYMGDGVLIYFGYPQAHELDAERAVRAGLEIARRAPAMDVIDNHRLQVRVGIETGLVVAGDIIGEGESKEHAVLGDTPNIAARLQTLAAPGSVVIGPGTHRIIKRSFSVEALGVQTLKGIATAMPAYRVTAVSGHQRPPALSPIVGRQHEIDRLSRCLSAPHRGNVVVIEGDSGFGKTRLLEQVIDSAAGLFERVVLRCSPFYSDRPLYPIVRHWQGLLGLQRGDEDGERSQKLHQYLRTHGIGDEKLSALLAATLFGPLPGDSPHVGGTAAQLRTAKLEALVELVKIFSLRKPMLIAVEDSHWIDSSTAEFLARLARQLDGLPLVLIMTSREPLAWLPEDLAALTRIRLAALPVPVLNELIDAISGERTIPEQIRLEILNKSDGSPLYVEELTKTVLELNLTGDQTIQVPSSLQDSLRARLDRLGATKEMAQFVAVLGRQFSHRLVHACTPFDVANTDSALDALVAAELLVATGSGARRGYAFRHAMVQEVAYHALLNRTKRSHHRRIAQAINDRLPDMLADSPEVLASHFELAGDTHRAIRFWHQAGRHASELWAHTEASNHFARAVALLASTSADDDLASVELSLRLDWVRSLRILERSEEGLEQLQLAEVIAQRLQRQSDLAVIHNLYGNIQFSAGDIEGCLASHCSALINARASGSRVDEIQALSGLGDANLLRGLAITAEQMFDRCLGLCQADATSGQASSSFSRFIPPNLSLRGHMRLYLNQLPQSEQDIDDAIRLAQAHHDRRTEMVARGSCLAKTLCEQGRYLDARQELEQALTIARSLAVPRFEALYLLFIVRTQALDQTLDQVLDEVRVMADQAIEIARQTGFRYVGSIAYGAKALVAPTSEQRIQALDDGEGLLASNGLSQNHFWFLRDAIEVSLRDRQWRRAEHYADALAGYTRQQPLPWSDLYIDIARTVARYGRGEHGAEVLSEIAVLRQNADQAGIRAALPLTDLSRCSG